jgi:hypothetical protein
MIFVALSALVLCQNPVPLPPNDVVWLRKPTSAEIDEVVPNTRYAWNVSFVIQCTITPTGELTDCSVSSRLDNVPAPEWSVKLARYFKAAPISRSGLPTADRVIRIPMTFTEAD